MFERFTNGSRRVMVFCQDEARKLGHNVIAPHHIALGLLRHEQERGRGPLTLLGTDLVALREAIVAESASHVPAGVKSGSPPFTPECKRVLELSLREALKLGDNFIGPGHQLLALLETRSPAALCASVELEAARAAVREHHEADEGESEIEPRRPKGQRGFIEVLKATMSRSEPDKPTGSQDLLLTLVSRQDTLAGRVLSELGVTEEKVRELIERLGTEGTIDDPPEPRVEIVVEGKTVAVSAEALRQAVETIGAHDPEAARALNKALDAEGT